CPGSFNERPEPKGGRFLPRFSAPIRFERDASSLPSIFVSWPCLHRERNALLHAARPLCLSLVSYIQSEPAHGHPPQTSDRRALRGAWIQAGGGTVKYIKLFRGNDNRDDNDNADGVISGRPGITSESSHRLLE